ncbi:hypothetical protein G9A89_020751 [Geosiphon pyriformis]|nr:hypothetical protein G9A89_020751 [Geosiphon pyriformis]
MVCLFRLPKRGSLIDTWKKLDSCGPVPNWFDIFVAFLVALYSSPLALAGIGPLDIHDSNNFISVCNCLSRVNTDSLSVYTNGSVKNLGTIGCRAEAAVFFENINLGLGVGVQDLMSSTLVELQAIALALKCVSVTRSVHLFLDNQTALNACRLESDLCKIKGHSGISGNNYANSFTNIVSLSGWYLPPCIDEHFLLVDGGVVSGNSRHFVCDVFCAVCRVHWEVGSGFRFLDGDLCLDINWLCSFRVWHFDLHMATGFTSRLTADTRTYFIKALHHWLFIAVQKHIYNKCYPSVLCLYCGKVEVSDHMFSCVVDDSAYYQCIATAVDLCFEFSGFSAFYKGFVFNNWLQEAISIFHDSKVAGVKISDFVNDIWLVYAKHHAFMEKNSLILVDGSILILVSGLVLGFLAGVIKLLGIAEAFGVRFGFCKSCSFFSGIGDPVSVNISV